MIKKISEKYTNYSTNNKNILFLIPFEIIFDTIFFNQIFGMDGIYKARIYTRGSSKPDTIQLNLTDMAFVVTNFAKNK